MSKAREISEVNELRARLREAEETLDAIRYGEVDALVVSGPNSEQVYTLKGADHSSRILLQEMSEGAVTLLSDGTILYCNNRFPDILQLPQEKVIGACVSDFVLAADRQDFTALIEQAKEERARAEIRFSTADGAQVPTYCSINPIALEDTHGLCLIVTDLTEQKRNEEILASGALARSILDQAAEGIIVCDQTGTIIEASRAARELCGRSILREPFKEAFPLTIANGSDVTCSTDFDGFLEGCLGGKSAHGLEARWHRPDGRELHLLMSVSPVHDSRGAPLGCVFTFSDISQLKAAEERLRASEQQSREQAQELEQQLIASGRLVSLGEITASMAHEFNNPLGIIMGFVEDMLAGLDATDPQYRSLQIIDEEAKRCQRIIQGLMQFARPVSTSRSLTDMGALVAKTLEMIDARLYKQKVTLTTAIAPDLPRIQVDPKQLEQVLVNLYLNALDAMSGGGRFMVAAAVAPDKQDPRIMITIADNGVGIADDDLPKIFQPFFTARKKAGLGLGLSICERIIKNHGGRIEVESQLNEGTIFRVLLPIDRPAL